MLKAFFLAPDGKLRPLWRAVLYYVANIVLFPLWAWPIHQLALWLDLSEGLSPINIAFGESFNFLLAFVCTGALALYEHRRIDSYGLPIDRALSGRTFEGFVVGVVIAGAVAVGMIAFGGMQVKGLALAGNALWGGALAWLGANLLVGIAEEFLFRSYLQQTLWKSIGFWPSAVVIALIFAAEHYFFKAGENVWDVITLVSLSLLMSYSILRTGTLWFAVGFHIAFDYMQFFVIGTPNGTEIPDDRLFNVTFNGPAWVNGGVLGTEASFLMYPAIALLWLYVWWRNRGKPALEV